MTAQKSLVDSRTAFGTAYGQFPSFSSLYVSGGAPPYSHWQISSGTAPPGLALFGAPAGSYGDPDGAEADLYGTPTAVGTFSFTVQVQDANGVIASRAYVVTVAPGFAKLVLFTAVPGIVAQQGSLLFTAIVTDAAGSPLVNPTGMIDFSVNGTAVGSRCLGGACGSGPNPAQFDWSAAGAPPGDDTVTATFSGDPDYTSATASIVVTVYVPREPLLRTAQACKDPLEAQWYGSYTRILALVTIWLRWTSPT